MRYDEKVSGPHDRRVHAGCGLIFGALLGVFFSMNTFETLAGFVIGTVGVAVIIAYCCARWGDPIWLLLTKHLSWFH